VLTLQARQRVIEMTEQNATEISMDASNLYREEVVSDRKMGTIRVMTPIKADGSDDEARAVVYVGQAQIMTPMGALPLAFEIEAASLQDAVEKFGAEAKQAIDNTMDELKELRRQAASSIVLPEAGGGMPGAGGLPGGGLPGGGKIQFP